MAARRQQRDTPASAEQPFDPSADVAIGVQHDLDGRNAIVGQPAQRRGDRAQAVAPILAPMAGDKELRHAAIAQARRRQLGPGFHQRVDAGVAGDEHRAADAFLHEILGGERRRREQQVGAGVDRGAIFLLGPRHGHVVAAQPGFDMGDRHSRCEAGQRAAERARGVALDDNQVGSAGEQGANRRGDALDVGMRVLVAGAAQPRRRIGVKLIVGGVEPRMLSS
ncbi:MAG: hypothetical protein ABI422_04535 [Sphingomicrobium sp.]